jgi:hypothetical protein
MKIVSTQIFNLWIRNIYYILIYIYSFCSPQVINCIDKRKNYEDWMFNIIMSSSFYEWINSLNTFGPKVIVKIVCSCSSLFIVHSLKDMYHKYETPINKFSITYKIQRKYIDIITKLTISIITNIEIVNMLNEIMSKNDQHQNL